MSDGLSGPHLAAAFLCEKVLYERDGVPSFIRIVERFFMPVLPKLPPGMQIQPPVLQLTLVLSLKAGSMPGGKYNVTVKLQKPDGSQMQDNALSVFFNGSDDNGVLIGMPMAIVAPDEGLYWFDIYFEESLMTRIPMRVLHQQVALPPFQSGQGQ
jgi:hypothetical protein